MKKLLQEGWAQADIAEEIGVTKGRVSQIVKEHGLKPAPSTADACKLRKRNSGLGGGLGFRRLGPLNPKPARRKSSLAAVCALCRTPTAVKRESLGFNYPKALNPKPRPPGDLLRGLV